MAALPSRMPVSSKFASHPPKLPSNRAVIVKLPMLSVANGTPSATSPVTGSVRNTSPSSVSSTSFSIAPPPDCVLCVNPIDAPFLSFIEPTVLSEIASG